MKSHNKLCLATSTNSLAFSLCGRMSSVFRNTEWNTSQPFEAAEKLCLSRWNSGCFPPTNQIFIQAEIQRWSHDSSLTPLPTICPQEFQRSRSRPAGSRHSRSDGAVKAFCTPRCYWAFLSALDTGRMHHIDRRTQTYISETIWKIDDGRPATKCIYKSK